MAKTDLVKEMRKPMPNLGLYRGPKGEWYIGEDNDRAVRVIGRVWSEEDGKSILQSMGERIKKARSAKQPRKRGKKTVDPMVLARWCWPVRMDLTHKRQTMP